MDQVMATDGEAQVEKAKEFIEKQRVFEAGTKELFKEDGPYTHGQNLGLLDILTGATLGFYHIQEEIFGAKFLDPETTPFLFSWVTAINEHPLIKELSPPLDKLVVLLQLFKQSLPISSSD
ncbi:Glutathione S-transferase, C-terminal-like [Trema orientale]|uniref:Glutathione S-transferase, C-terminal-like n=1 Tax=Trema orientale TaxID=63057 RepID=A0A2P5F723_TREOI|nr:Glutathione S-transferase, C-terminal-like [Trema orientale]